MRNLQVLLLPKNKISKIEGPFKDLREATELQLKREVMKLKLLDVRENEFRSLNRFLEQSAKFLKETVILAWDNKYG